MYSLTQKFSKDDLPEPVLPAIPIDVWLHRHIVIKSSISGLAVPASISISLVIRDLLCFRIDPETPQALEINGGIDAEIRVLEPMKLSTRGVCASRILPPIRTMRLTISNAASGEAKASSS